GCSRSLKTTVSISPFEHFTCVYAALEFFWSNKEVIHPVLFACTRRTCGHRHADVQPVYTITQARYHRRFTNRCETCQHGKPSAVISDTHRRLLGKAETLQKGMTLTVAQAAQTAGLSDFEVFHDLASFNLANLWKSFKQCRNLGLTDDLIGLCLLKDVLQGGVTALE